MKSLILLKFQRQRWLRHAETLLEYELLLDIIMNLRLHLRVK